MKKSVKTILTIVAVIALVASLSVAFAACNKPDTNKYPNGVITIACTEFDPMNYDMNTDNPKGFDTELATIVFTNLGYKPNFKLIPWKNKYVELNADNVQCLWNGFTANSQDDGKDRSEYVDFSYSYMTNYQAVVVKDENLKNKNFADFTGIGAFEEGSAGQDFYANFTKAADKKICQDQNAALMAVKADTAQFAIVDILLANTQCGKGDLAELKINTVIKSSEAEKYAIGFKKGSALTAKVNEQLVKLLEDGTIKRLAEKYALTEMYVKDYSDQIAA